jgi:hypothetical protein
MNSKRFLTAKIWTGDFASKDPERQSLDRGVPSFTRSQSFARTWREHEYKLQHHAHKAKE